jgi:hypothetical protein
MVILIFIAFRCLDDASFHTLVPEANRGLPAQLDITLVSASIRMIGTISISA